MVDVIGIRPAENRIIDKSKGKLPWFIWAQLFLTPFCYPFRPWVSSLTHIHVYIIMYSTISVVLFYLLYKTKKIVISKYMVFVLMYYVVMFPVSIDYDTGLKWIINIFIGMLMGGLLYHASFYVIHASPFILGTIICSVVLQPSVLKYLHFSMEYMYEVRIPFMEGDISIGPNSWAQTLSLSFLILLIMLTKIRKKRSIVLLGLLATVYFLLLTQSRTQVYALVGVTALLIANVLFDKRQNIVNRMMFLFMAMIGMMAVALLVVQAVSGMSSTTRLLAFDLNGRDAIWETSKEIIENKMNPLQILFGTGTGSTSKYLYQSSSAFNGDLTGHISAHNIYLDAFFSLGIIGFFITIGYWVRAVWILFKMRNVMFVFPLFILISGLGAHLFLNWEYCIYISFTEYALYKHNIATKKQIKLVI